MVDDIFERVKDVISHQYPDSKVLDKNVAHALGIKPASLSMMKKRGHIPYDEVTMFCIRNNVSANWMLFGVGQMELHHAS